MPLCTIVTGSSSGIGRAVAQRLAAEGFVLVLSDGLGEPTNIASAVAFLTSDAAISGINLLVDGGWMEY